MRKQNNHCRQMVLPTIIAVIFLLCVTMLTFAQDAAKFKVGDRIKDPDSGAPATIVKIEPGWLTVKYDDKDGNYEIMSSGRIILLDANGKPIVDNKNAPMKETEKTDAKNDEQTKIDGSGEYKVGDRVKVTKSGLEGDENLQPCTITSGLEDRSYEVRCDPHGGLPYMDYKVFARWIYPWANASAAPQLECSFDAPIGTASNKAVPSAQLFKRVIYEREAEAVKAQYGANVRYGLQFTTFQMGTPFKNVMTGRGLMRDSVPQNAMYYPIKTKYKECREVINGDYNRSQVIKENYGCYKDSFGDWVCGTDSDLELLEQQDVPKKPVGEN